MLVSDYFGVNSDEKGLNTYFYRETFPFCHFYDEIFHFFNFVTGRSVFSPLAACVISLFVPSSYALTHSYLMFFDQKVSLLDKYFVKVPKVGLI